MYFDLNLTSGIKDAIRETITNLVFGGFMKKVALIIALALTVLGGTYAVTALSGQPVAQACPTAPDC